SNIIYLSGRSIQANPNTNLGFSDTLSWIRGSHSLSMGGEMWWESLNIKLGQSGSATAYPTITTSIASNPANVPALPPLSSTDRSRAQQLVNDLTGAIGTVTQNFYLTNTTGYTPFTPSYNPMHNREWSAYVQDLWRWKPNLSLNLGLRYEILPIAYKANS